MWSVILTASMVVGFQGSGDSAKARVTAELRLALACEAKGDSAGRRAHLERAIALNSGDDRAWGLLGRVLDQGSRVEPEVAVKRLAADRARSALLAQYANRRSQALATADSQLELASWCDEHGLKPQALAHYLRVLSLDSTRDVVWKRLGYKRQNDRWMKAEDAAAARRIAEQRHKYERESARKLARIRDDIDGRNPVKARRAIQAFEQIDDPRAVPLIWSIFLKGGEKSQIAAVERLSEIEGAAASQCLAALAVFSPRASVRAAATNALIDRDPREFVPRLIALVRKPYDYEVRPASGPGSTTRIIIKQDKDNLELTYTQPFVNPAALPRFFASNVSFNPFSVQNMIMASAIDNPGTVSLGSSSGPGGGRPNANNYLAFQTYAAAAERDYELGMIVAQNLAIANQMLQQKFANDVQTIEATNSKIKEVDDRALSTLRAVTGRDYGVAPARWKAWWAIVQGYLDAMDQADSKKPSEIVIQPPGKDDPVSNASLAGGTLVQTSTGARTVESVRVGDLVLAQDVATGRLEYKPVLATSRHPESFVRQVDFEGETSIRATRLVSFWKVDTGWTKVSNLKPGDRIRRLGSVIVVRQVGTQISAPCFNVDVADSGTLFAGPDAVLVHDNGLVEQPPVQFDAVNPPARAGG